MSGNSRLIARDTFAGKRRLGWLLGGVLVLALPGCFLMTPASAQSVNVFDAATVTGTVVDPSGAAIPDATVTILNTGTGLKKTLRSNGAGNFTAAALPFGDYTLTAVTYTNLTLPTTSRV
jgi:hypothetical protein